MRTTASLVSRALCRTLGVAAVAANLSAAALEASASAQDSSSEARNSSPKPSVLLLEKAEMARNGDLRFPMMFEAASGETVGSFQATVTIPGVGSKFKKIEAVSGSRLRISTKEKKQGNDRSVVEVTVSAGSRAIRDGIVGTLVISAPNSSKTSGPSTDTPTLEVRLTSVAPPEAESSSDSSLPPIAPPPPPEPNPSTGCFVFSH